MFQKIIKAEESFPGLQPLKPAEPEIQPPAKPTPMLAPPIAAAPEPLQVVPATSFIPEPALPQPLASPLFQQPKEVKSESSPSLFVKPAELKVLQPPPGYRQFHDDYEDPSLEIHGYSDYFPEGEHETDLHRKVDDKGVSHYWSPGAHSSHPDAYNSDCSIVDISGDEYKDDLKHLLEEG